MCGITGVAHADRERPVDAELLDAMTATLARRGPDAGGRWIGAGVGLGHWRLGVIDLAGGGQPMTDASDHLVLIYNGTPQTEFSRPAHQE